MKQLFAEPVWDEERQFWHRGPADIFVGDEQKSYKALKEGAPYDCVLDVGAHIGWFTRYAKQELGAGFVYAIEPDPNSAAIYRMNHRPGDYGAMVSFHEAAVTTLGPETLDLQLSHKYPANNRSDRAIRGRRTVRVKTMDFHETLFGIHNLELVKVDIEGAEYGLDFLMPKTVRAVAIEYHQFDPEMLAHQEKLHNILCEQGFVPKTAPKMKQTFQKITTGVYLR